MNPLLHSLSLVSWAAQEGPFPGVDPRPDALRYINPKLSEKEHQSGVFLSFAIAFTVCLPFEYKNKLPAAYHCKYILINFMNFHVHAFIAIF